MKRPQATPLALAIGLTFTAPLALADDEAFLTEAISGDIAEVQLGKLAQEKGQSEEVRDFGQKLVEDHQKAMDEAIDIAQGAGVTPPRQAMPDAQREYQRLARLSGEEFDREFVQHMIMDHEKHIAKFEQQAEQQGGATDAAHHAHETLPSLEAHLRIAQSIDRQQR